MEYKREQKQKKKRKINVYLDIGGSFLEYGRELIATRREGGCRAVEHGCILGGDESGGRLRSSADTLAEGGWTHDRRVFEVFGTSHRDH